VRKHYFFIFFLLQFPLETFSQNLEQELKKLSTNLEVLSNQLRGKKTAQFIENLRTITQSFQAAEKESYEKDINKKINTWLIALTNEQKYPSIQTVVSDIKESYKNLLEELFQILFSFYKLTPENSEIAIQIMQQKFNVPEKIANQYKEYLQGLYTTEKTIAEGKNMSKDEIGAVLDSLTFLPQLSLIKKSYFLLSPGYEKRMKKIISDLAQLKNIAPSQIERLKNYADKREIKVTIAPEKKAIPFLVLSQDQMIDKTTNNYVTTDIPIKLSSGSEVLQVQVFSQFTYAGDFSSNPINTGIETGEKIPFYINRLKETNPTSTINKIKILDNYILLGAGTASCGYHALKNALHIIGAIKEPVKKEEHIQKLLDIEYANELFGTQEVNAQLLNKNKPGTWRQRAMTNVGWSQPNGDWLSKDGIELLYDYIKQKNSLLQNVNLTVVSDASIPQTAFFKNKIQEFKKNNLHIFIIIEKQPESFTGHWYALIAVSHKNKNQYIIVDSANAPRYEKKYLSQSTYAQDILHSTVQAVIKTLEKNKK